MGNIIKKIKDKVSGWFGKKKEKNFAGTTETPLLSNQYFNSAVRSFVNSFASNIAIQRPMAAPSNNNYSTWFNTTFVCHIGHHHFTLLNLILDDNSNPIKIEIGKGDGIKLELFNQSVKCPTRDLIVYKRGDWKIFVDDGNSSLTLDYLTRYRFRMLGEDYHWTMVEVIRPDRVPDRFRGFRDAEMRSKEYEKLFKDWEAKVGYGNLKP